ncbi:peptidase A4 family-domain-containing protein [Cubamyces lactineus]|nr:peptidase A4 family-domain-containing protein [Cubamyces lactineus]
MLFSSLLFHVFVATATLAIPTTGEQGTHQAADTTLLKPVQPAPDAAVTTVPAASTVAQDQTTDNWAGVALTFGAGAVVKSVTGTFTVPVPNPPPGGDPHEIYESAAWLGIDGYACDTALLRTGAGFIHVNGIVTANVWYEWFPSIPRTYLNLTVIPGDIITATVTASTPQSGTVAIVNNSTGEQMSIALDSADYAPLCRESGEWIVGFPSQPNGTQARLPLPDFGKVTFSGAFASVYDPTSPVTTVFNIADNGTTLTSVSTEYDTVIIDYIGV